MPLELYMVGVIVDDMPRAVEFYRRLGVAIPEGSETQKHVEVKMGPLTFFLHNKRLNGVWDPARTDASGGYRVVLEFYLETRQAVQAKYEEMIAFGYEGHMPPNETPIKTYFAMINDPDGNSILLSADLNSP